MNGNLVYDNFDLIIFNDFLIGLLIFVVCFVDILILIVSV